MSMISCIEWVPKGVADPTPQRYKLSAAELELMAELQEEHEKDPTKEPKASTLLEESDEDSDDDEEEEKGATTKKSVLPPVDLDTLPKDLRMDDYSSDEEDAEAKLGDILVGNDDMDDDMDSDEDDADELEKIEEDPANKVSEVTEDEGSKEDIDSDDSDSDEGSIDDREVLYDTPDTREYTPVNVEGLRSMAVGFGGGGREDFEDEEDDESATDDVNLRPDDALILVAKTEEDFASLEVHVYEQNTGNLYVHHDIPLPSYPVCLAHGDIICGDGNNNSEAQPTPGNFCAVGMFDHPGIEIWNLDILDVLEPTSVLGGLVNHPATTTSKKKKKKRATTRLSPGSHTDTVMCLDWNKVHRQIIASGSADHTVKLWDVTRQNGAPPASTCTHHTDKVQSVKFHPTEGTLLATGSFDRTVAVVDARTAVNGSKSGSGVLRMTLSADCEGLAWDPHHMHNLTAASEDGVVSTWDVRMLAASTSDDNVGASSSSAKTTKPIWSMVAHETGVSDISYNPYIPGFLTTCGIDQTLSLWDCQHASQGIMIENNKNKPVRCGGRNMKGGKLYTLSFYPSTPWLVGCAGSGNELCLWDLREEESVQHRFAERLASDVQPNLVDGNDGDTTKEPDFEAVMTAGDDAASKARENMTKNTKKGKDGKKKKKPHRKGK